MDIDAQKKLVGFIKKYEQAKQEIAEDIIRELKKGCETSADLVVRLDQFEKLIYWETNPIMAASLLNKLQEIKNDLPLKQIVL